MNQKRKLRKENIYSKKLDMIQEINYSGADIRDS